MFITQPLSQRDPRWKGARLGFSRLSIGSDGCTLTCLTMIANGFGCSETPATLNDKLRALGRKRGFSGPRMVWAGLGRVFPQIQLTQYIPRRAGPMDMRAVDEALARNKPVLAEVDLSPAPGFQNHWILIVAKDGDDYVIHDPWTAPAVESELLRKRYGFGGGPAQIIRRIVLYDNPGFNAGQPGPQPEALFVQVNDDPDVRAYGGLPLREAPNFLSRELARAPIGESLRCLDAAQAVTDKLGVFGEWLRVRFGADGAGGAEVEGFVAAWLLHAAAEGDDAGDGEDAVQPALERFATASVKRSAKLRDAPSKGRIVATIKPGAVLKLAEDPSDEPHAKPVRGRWLRVRHGQNEGYVSSTFVTVNAEMAAADSAGDSPPEARASTTAADSRPMLRVIAPVGLNLRAQPAVSARAKKVLKPGTLLALREPPATIKAKLGQAGQWISAATFSGIDGYVAAEYVVMVATPDPLVRQQGVALAEGDIHLQRAPDLNDTVWRVAGGTPLSVALPADWSKIGDAAATLKVRTPGFKEGFVRGSQLRPPPISDRRSPAHDGAISRGASAWLYGLQAPYDRALLGGAKTGWVVFREHVGGDRSGSSAYEDWTHNGWGVIACLEPAQPLDPEAFAQQCASWVRHSRGCRTWVVADWAVNALRARQYAVLFNRARAAIKAAQPQALVVAAAPHAHMPRADGDHPLDVFARALRGITDLDGLALQTSTDGDAPELITDLTPHAELAQRGVQRHFRAYGAFLDQVPARFRRKPVFVTCAGPQNGRAQPGWAAAAYDEIARHNAAAHAQQIHALALAPFPGADQQLRAAAAAGDARWRC